MQARSYLSSYLLLSKGGKFHGFMSRIDYSPSCPVVVFCFQTSPVSTLAPAEGVPRFSFIRFVCTFWVVPRQAEISTKTRGDLGEQQQAWSTLEFNPVCVPVLLTNNDVL